MADTDLKKAPSGTPSILKKPGSKKKLSKSGSITAAPAETSSTKGSVTKIEGQATEESVENGPTTEVEEIVSKVVEETEEVTTKVTQEATVVQEPKKKKDSIKADEAASASQFDAPSEISGNTEMLFKKDEAPGTRSSQTIVSPKPLRYAESKTEILRKQNEKPLKPKKFPASLTKIHEKWTKLEKDSKFQLNTLYPRSVEPGAMEQYKTAQAYRQYSYDIKVGQEEHARLPPDRPGMAQSDEDNLKLLPEVTEREARKHLTERVSKRKLKQTPQKKKKKKQPPRTASAHRRRHRIKHHHHHIPEVPGELPHTPPLLDAPPPPPPSEEPLPSSQPSPIKLPTPPPSDPKAAGDIKKKKKKKKKKRRHKHSSSSSTSYASNPPCCFQAYNMGIPNVCGNACAERDSSCSSDEGLDFQFRPAHPDCATEVTLTIEPDEQEPLEYALDNGIRPVICCTMPPCLMVTPNIYQQPQCCWGQQQGYGNNGYSPQQGYNGNGWSPQQGYNGSPQQGYNYNGSPQQGYNGLSPMQQAYYNAAWQLRNCYKGGSGNNMPTQQKTGSNQQMNYGSNPQMYYGQQRQTGSGQFPQQTGSGGFPQQRGSGGFPPQTGSGGFPRQAESNPAQKQRQMGSAQPSRARMNSNAPNQRGVNNGTAASQPPAASQLQSKEVTTPSVMVKSPSKWRVN